MLSFLILTLFSRFDFMRISFDSFLKEIVLKKHSRSELLVILHLYSEKFLGLDSITLSRWVNGATKPSSFKQLLIADACHCLNEYLSQCEIPSIPICQEKKYKTFMSLIDGYYHFLSKNTNESFWIKNMTYAKSKSLYWHYLNKLSEDNAILKFDKRKPSVKVNIVYSAATECSAASSFICLIEQPSLFIEIINKLPLKINIDSSDGVIFITLSYFKSSVDFECLIGLLSNYVILNLFNKNDVIFIVRGEKIPHDFYMSLKSYNIGILEKTKNLGNVYLYKADLKELIASPIILKFAMTMHEHYLDLIGN